MGELLYRRLGFRIVGAHRWLLVVAAKTATSLARALECLVVFPALT